MRTKLLGILLSVLFAFPAMAADTPAGSDPAPVPVASDWTLDTSVTWKSGREFMDQGFLFTGNNVRELDATLCKDGLCFNLWRADTRKKSEHETDFQVWKDFALGGGTLQLKAAYYELAGPDVPEVKVTYTYPLGTACSVAASYEELWNGFRDTVAKAKGSCGIPVSDRVTINASAQISHTENFDQWVPGGEIGASIAIGKGFGLRTFVKGYGGREPDMVGGISLSKSFGR